MKKLANVRLKYTLEVVQNDEFDFEYDGPPLAIVDNDVGLVGEVTAIPELTSVLTPYNDLSVAVAKFETGADGVVGLAARPEHYFCLSEQENGMRLFHNG